jgi:exodeoxyribonuclease-5
MEFSKDQKNAMDSITDWYTSYTHRLQSYLMGGAAGVGKSTIISHLDQYLMGVNIAYVAYTGKAATVLRKKMTALGVDPSMVSTIHALMYKPVIDEATKEIISWKKNNSLSADLIVVDEASMVPKEIYVDLLSYGIPLLFVGDHYQLPPVSNEDFNLMEDPFTKLETPHRFAADSPIVKLATKIRNGEYIKYGNHGSGVSKRRMRDVTKAEAKAFFQSNELKRGESIVLCGFNKTRVKLNDNIRKTFGFPDDMVVADERVICLRNNKKSNIPLFNGSIGTVKFINHRFKKAFKCIIEMDGFDDFFKGNVYSDIFGEQKPDVFNGRDLKTQCFDHGYAISVHKSQGSSWNRVCVFEEQCDLWDNMRWLYTAVTRAENELLIIKN